MSLQRIIVLVLLFTILLGLGWLGSWWMKEEEAGKHWAGVWEVDYFYENESQLWYSGTLKLALKDSLHGRLEIFPPAGKRAEIIDLLSLSLSEDGLTLNGELLHDQYKIRGGHLREQFEWQLTEAGVLTGRGKCLAHCAEGTENTAIVWQGKHISRYQVPGTGYQVPKKNIQ